MDYYILLRLKWVITSHFCDYNCKPSEFTSTLQTHVFEGIYESFELACESSLNMESDYSYYNWSPHVRIIKAKLNTLPNLYNQNEYDIDLNEYFIVNKYEQCLLNKKGIIYVSKSSLMTENIFKLYNKILETDISLYKDQFNSFDKIYQYFRKINISYSIHDGYGYVYFNNPSCIYGLSIEQINIIYKDLKI
jgi:hypothetical protein